MKSIIIPNTTETKTSKIPQGTLMVYKRGTPDEYYIITTVDTYGLYDNLEGVVVTQTESSHYKIGMYFKSFDHDSFKIAKLPVTIKYEN